MLSVIITHRKVVLIQNILPSKANKSGATTFYILSCYHLEYFPVPLPNCIFSYSKRDLHQLPVEIQSFYHLEGFVCP